MNSLIQLLSLTFVGSILGLVGGVVFLFNKKYSKSLEANAIPFAAGVLITVSLLGLFPEAVEMLGDRAYLAILIAFFATFVFEKIIMEVHHHAGDNHSHHPSIKHSAPLVVVGDTIHNFIDGAAIGVSFLASPGLGLITALSSFLHEVPHEVGDFGVLLKAGWKKLTILKVNFISACASFLGAIVVYYLPLSTEFEGVLLSVSAGIFLYLGAIDFLPQVVNGEGSKKQRFIPLLLGVVVMLLTVMAVPHSHEHAGDEESPHMQELQVK